MNEQLTADTFVAWLAQECRKARTIEFQPLWEISLTAWERLRSFPPDEQEKALQAVKQCLDTGATAGNFFPQHSLEAECFISLLNLVYDPPQIL